MVNKCVAFGCKTGYVSEKTADGSVENDEKNHVATFHFPFRNPELLHKWVKFINRRDWIPYSTAVLCEKHFEEEYISKEVQFKVEMQSHSYYSLLRTIVKRTIHLTYTSRLEKTSENTSKTGR